MGIDEFAQSQNRRSIRKAVRRKQILPQQIVRHLDGFNRNRCGRALGRRGDNAAGSHRRAAGFLRAHPIAARRGGSDEQHANASNDNFIHQATQFRENAKLCA